MAKGGTILNKIKSIIMSIITKKWQNLQGFPSSPQGTSPLAQAELRIKKKLNKQKKEIKNIFFIVVQL